MNQQVRRLDKLGSNILMKFVLENENQQEECGGNGYSVFSPTWTYFTPAYLYFLSSLFRFDKIFSSLCVENEKSGSVLLCFLGVALLKIVYKKANQRADFYLYKYIFGISVQLNDMVLNKSRAIAGQRGSSLLYQQ